jgi:hypothetical protein
LQEPATPAVLATRLPWEPIEASVPVGATPMDRCSLQGSMGDALHAISWAAGYNLRKAHAQDPLGDGAAPPVMGPLDCMQRMAALVLWPPDG